MYNPLGAHRFASHDSYRPEWADAELPERIGQYAIRDATQPNWKYLLYD